MSEESNNSNIVKYAVAGAVGIGVGVAGASYADDGPTQNQYEDLQDDYDTAQDKIDDLQEKKTQLQNANEDYTDEVEQLEEEIAELETTVAETEERADNLERAVQQREYLVKEALGKDFDYFPAERTHIVDYLPVFDNVDVEFHAEGVTADGDAESGFTFQVDSYNVGDDYDGEYDAVRVDYKDTDGKHDYRVEVREFEYERDADEFEEELRTEVDYEDYDEKGDEDAAVYRDGNTVVYLRGEEDSSNTGYDFAGFAAQYE